MLDPRIVVTPHANRSRHELVVDGEAVSWLWIVDLTVRIGASRVRAGGIAGVETKPAHRRRGYSRRVLEHSTRWMQDAGYDCALLFGIPDYYPKFGYATCLPDATISVRTRAAERAPASLIAEPLQDADLNAVAAIYERENAELTGTVVRRADHAWFHKGSTYEKRAECWVFRDANGAAQAYAVRDVSEDAAVVTEVGATSGAGYASVVLWAGDRAAEVRAERIVFHVSPTGLFAESLAQYGAEEGRVFPAAAGGMGRLIRPESFFTKTLDEWTRRAAACSPPSGVSVRFETELGAVTLNWNGARIEMGDGSPGGVTVRLPQSRLMQLAMGYYGAEMIALLPDVEADGDTPLLHVLFPRRLPYMWAADQF